MTTSVGHFGPIWPSKKKIYILFFIFFYFIKKQKKKKILKIFLKNCKILNKLNKKIFYSAWLPNTDHYYNKIENLLIKII